MLNKILIYLILFSFFVLPQEDTTETQSSFYYSTISDFWVQMDDLFNDPNFSSAHWGVLIQSLETGEYFYKRNEDKLFVPASNLKLFTSAAALVDLTPDYQYKTGLYLKGTMEGPAINGDLIIRGSGDPTISGRFYNDDMLFLFNAWADSLLELGIDEIRGNIIGDDNAFDDIGLGYGWAWDYESYWYAAPSGALSLNDNCIDIIVSPTEVGKKANIKILPDTKYAIIINKVLTVDDDSAQSINVYRERGTNVITVEGFIKENTKEFKTYATINNPTQFFVVVFKEVLEKKGIKVKGYPIDIDELNILLDYDSMILLAEHTSVDLREIVKVINKNSQNFFAEQLLKTIGYENYGLGSADNGVRALKNILSEMGINPDNIKIVDGSGLSRLNFVSPKHIISLLNYMHKNPYFIPFLNSLPIAGVDGTIGKRMTNNRATNNVRAKTGFVGAVRSLSGYVRTGDNELVAFSIIANNFTVPVKLAENIQDLVCLRLANFKRK